MCSDIREKSIAAVRIFLSKEKLTLLPSAATVSTLVRGVIPK